MRRAATGTLGLAGLLAGLWAMSPTAAPEAQPPDPAPIASSLPTAVQMVSPELGDIAVATADAPVNAAALYRDGERLVRVTDPMEFDTLVSDHGLSVVRPVGRSGFGVVHGPADALAAMQEDDRVAQTVRHAVSFGTSAGQAHPHQWHFNSMQVAPLSVPSSFVVAVLDTGVAYETATRFGKRYARAPSLASSPIVAPYDFINDDRFANDDHQHGTHIASIIASNGVVKGITPGVGLMPVKVLDKANCGTEYALIEGIWHAIDNGADVINMSLSFDESYQPSVALLEALQAASDAGVVMVGAAGNEGAHYVSWPAASPHVIAVGAATADSSSRSRRRSDYGNASATIDVMAPGGDIRRDRDGNGLPDGILAESINPNNPRDVGYWLMAGTSQASAIVSGLAVKLLSEGVVADNVRTSIQKDAERRDFFAGIGAGYLELEWHHKGVDSHSAPKQYFVAMLPFIEDAGNGKIRPAAKVTLFDSDGETPSASLDILGNILGSAPEIVHCKAGNGQPSCVLRGAAVPKHKSTGQQVPWAWGITVDAVSDGRVSHRPTVAITTTPAVEALVDAMQKKGNTKNAVVAWSWTNRQVSDLGTKVSAGYSVINSGSGLASIPLGVVLTPPVLNQLGNVQSTQLTVKGHKLQGTLLHVNGSGLASIPLGIRPFRIFAIDGSGLASIPLGIKADDMQGGGNILVPLDRRQVPASLRNTTFGKVIEDGGWRVDGYGFGTTLLTSSALGIAPAQLPGIDGSGAGSKRYQP